MYEIPSEKELDSKEKIASAFSSVGQFILSFLETVVVALVISIVLYIFIMTPHEVVGNSMHPHIQKWRVSNGKQGNIQI